ncbi:hypothetical protein [Spirochaeta isovalerica]|uniref:HEPN domain-containing protein n=1 Tax=Spirochaeta isovalerica TaxID=150 RepID=A0A841R8C6_9SPIO|nr:hypothetical protein [Spirochaeta isovalerica]MBB6481534.1 hypothetical protein [Spirochaeta isovalerica]
MIFKDVPNDLDETWNHGALWGGMASTVDNADMVFYYRSSIEILLSNFQDKMEPYEVINPLLFLYRHTLELYLKVILSKWDNDFRPKEYNHNLKKLLNHVVQNSMEHDVSIPDKAKQIIIDFHEHDSGSFTFRYGEGFKDGEYWIDFNKLRRKMDWLFDGFERILKLRFVPNTEVAYE